MGWEDGDLNHQGGHKSKGYSLIPMDWGVFIFFLNNVCLLEDAYYEANWMKTISSQEINQ
jgi:hypothetical protein